MREHTEVWAIVDEDNRVQKDTIVPACNQGCNDNRWDSIKIFLRHEGVRFWLRFFWPTKTWDMYQKFGYRVQKFYLQEI